jgi:adenylate kinase
VLAFDPVHITELPHVVVAAKTPMATTSKLPDDVVAYMKEKNVPDLLEYMLQELIAVKPESPVAFFKELLSKPVTPKILIAGPPAGGKGTQCEQIVEKHGVVHISTGDLLRAEVKAQSEEGKQADEFMKAGALVPDSVIIEMVKKRLQQDDVKAKGWLLDGFPRTKSQAQALQDAGIVPQIMVQLEVPDDVLIERIEGRRTDPVTGKVYHLKFNPPPSNDAEVMKRLEQRKDDTREAMVSRLATYHKNVDEILGFYTHVLFKTNGNREKDGVTFDVLKAIESRLPK